LSSFSEKNSSEIDFRFWVGLRAFDKISRLSVENSSDKSLTILNCFKLFTVGDVVDGPLLDDTSILGGLDVPCDWVTLFTEGLSPFENLTKFSVENSSDKSSIILNCFKLFTVGDPPSDDVSILGDRDKPCCWVLLFIGRLRPFDELLKFSVEEEGGNVGGKTTIFRIFGKLSSFSEKNSSEIDFRFWVGLRAFDKISRLSVENSSDKSLTILNCFKLFTVGDVVDGPLLDDTSILGGLDVPCDWVTLFTEGLLPFENLTKFSVENSSDKSSTILNCLTSLTIGDKVIEPLLDETLPGGGWILEGKEVDATGALTSLSLDSIEFSSEKSGMILKLFIFFDDFCGFLKSDCNSLSCKSVDAPDEWELVLKFRNSDLSVSWLSLTSLSTLFLKFWDGLTPVENVENPRAVFLLFTWRDASVFLRFPDCNGIISFSSEFVPEFVFEWLGLWAINNDWELDGFLVILSWKPFIFFVEPVVSLFSAMCAVWTDRFFMRRSASFPGSEDLCTVFFWSELESVIVASWILLGLDNCLL